MNLKNLDEKALAMIELMGGTGFNPEQIAEVLEVDETIFLEEFASKNSIIYKRYRKGFLESELKLRMRILKDAGHGSSPAQAMAKKIMDECLHKMKMS